MKLSDLRKLVHEEVDRVMSEKTIARREPPRKMTRPQITDRDGIGKSIKKSPKAIAYFKKKFGDDWESYLWASATNKAIGDGVEPVGKEVIQEMIRLRDISPVFARNALTTEDWNAAQFTEEDGEGDAVDSDMDGEHVRAQLMRLNKQTAALYNMLGDVDDVEDWVSEKIKRAAAYISSAYNHVEYEKKKPESLGNGEGTAADTAGV